MSPRPGSSVIHPQMVTRAQVVVEGTLRETVQLQRRTDLPATYDPALQGYTPSPPQVLWAGPGRAQPLTENEREDIAGEQRTTLRRYQVTLPMSAPPAAVGDLILVTTSPDPQLTGRTLQVRDVLRGDYQAQRQLLCDDDEG